jgi:hypothetical protein
VCHTAEEEEGGGGAGRGPQRVSAAGASVS